MVKIPTDKLQFIQPNNSDVEGNLFTTFNCDFDTNKGVLKLAERLVLNTSVDDVAEILGAPIGFKYFHNGTDTSVYTAAGVPGGGVGYVFKASTPSSNFSKVVTSGAPATIDSAVSDIETAFGELYVSSPTGSKVYYLTNGNVWGNFTAGGGGNDNGMMCHYGDRVYITKNGNQIQSFDSAHTVTSPTNANALQLGTGEVITFLRAASNRIWIGTVNLYGGRGFIYEWDGAATQVSKSYILESGGALSCVVKDDVPYVIDANGSLLAWNGGTFVKLTQFYRKNQQPLYNALGRNNNRFIHPNGMAIIRNIIHILVDLTNNDVSSHGGTQEECNPSGIWIYDKDTKDLKHKHAFTLTKSGATIVDYGQFRIYAAGGLAELINVNSIANGSFSAGCGFYSDASTVKYGMFYNDVNDTLAKGGYLVTPKMAAANVTDMWSNLYAFHEKFLNAADKMIIKYRTIRDIPTEFSLIWQTTKAFTTTTDLSAYVIGDEIEIIQGIGSGVCAHIANIVPISGSGSKVTLDQTFVGATLGTSTAKGRAMKYRWAGDIQDADDFDEAPFNTPGFWIQVKAFMLWTGMNVLRKLEITSKPSKGFE